MTSSAFLSCLLALPCGAEQKGTVGFEGAVTQSACAVATPSRSWWALPGNAGRLPVGAYAESEVPFSLTIEACAPHVFEAASMNMLGVADEADDAVLALTPGADAASGLGIIISGESGDIIRPNSPLPPSVFSRLSERVVLLPLRARYAETSGTITPGKTNGHAIIAVEHN